MIFYAEYSKMEREPQYSSDTIAYAQSSSPDIPAVIRTPVQTPRSSPKHSPRLSPRRSPRRSPTGDLTPRVVHKIISFRTKVKIVCAAILTLVSAAITAYFSARK